MTDNKETAYKLISLLNNYSVDLKEIAEHLANEHPTLQQTFMRLAMYFIYAEAKEGKYSDLRNEQTVKIARKLALAVPFEDAYLPFI